jgi:hypothetical protein
MYKYFFLVLALCLLSCKTKVASVQETTKQATKKLGANPYFVVNGEPVDKKTFASLNEKDITNLSIITGKEATDLYNENGKDGVITVQTRAYAKKKFQTTFRALSNVYDEMIDNYQHDEIQYILNKKPLEGNFEGSLSLIDASLLKSIKIIDSAKLSRKYGITDKKVGVVIKAKAPKNLYNAGKRF